MNTTEVVAEMRPEKNSQRKKQLDNEKLIRRLGV